MTYRLLQCSNFARPSAWPPRRRPCSPSMGLRALPLLLLALTAFGARADAIDRLVSATQVRERIPGIALLIVRDGRVVRVGCYGVANLEHAVPVKRTTVFQSGSLGKQFTAAAVLLLAERGKLSLDDGVRRYLPEAPPEWEAITIRELLDHTSGIRDSEDGGEIFELRREYTDAELVGVAKSFPLDFAPGTAWKYNNTGYILAGIIVTRVAGVFYGDFIAREFFRPLGMRSARIISDTDIVPNRAAGYLRTPTGVRNQDFASAALNATADGSLYLSLDDWAAWIAGLDRRALLSSASYDLLWGVGKSADGPSAGHGFGWDSATLDGHPVLEFDGSWQGFRSAIERDPAKRLTVVVLANLAEAVPEAIARDVLREVARYASR